MYYEINLLSVLHKKSCLGRKNVIENRNIVAKNYSDAFKCCKCTNFGIIFNFPTKTKVEANIINLQSTTSNYYDCQFCRVYSEQN